MNNEKLMQDLYYNPNTQLTSIRNLYNAVKQNGVKYKEVRNFIQSQESNQLFKKQKRIKNYFPIAAKHKFEILQIDLVDMSDIAAANENYKYLVVCIDVFSRLAFVVPLKTKSTTVVNDALEEVFDITEPHTIDCDVGSEFISHAFKALVKERGIDVQYIPVQEKNKLGILNRFVRTLREKLNKYMAIHNTTKYIDILPTIVHNYNNTYHSGIKKAPNKVEDDDKEIIELTRKKIEKAKQEETIFEIGDVVRYIINLTSFQKGTLPKWSKAIHKVTSKNKHSYVLDNGKTYKYYELQKINDIQRIDREQTEPTREQLRKQRTSERRFRLEGLDKRMIID